MLSYSVSCLISFSGKLGSFLLPPCSVRYVQTEDTLRLWGRIFIITIVQGCFEGIEHIKCLLGIAYWMCVSAKLHSINILYDIYGAGCYHLTLSSPDDYENICFLINVKSEIWCPSFTVRQWNNIQWLCLRILALGFPATEFHEPYQIWLWMTKCDIIFSWWNFGL